MADLKIPRGDVMVELSGGIDSVTLLQVANESRSGRVAGLFVDFGQTNAAREHAFAQKITNRLGIPLHFGDLPNLVKLIWGEADPPHILIAEKNSSGIQPTFAMIASRLGYEYLLQALTYTDVQNWDGLDYQKRNEGINNLLEIAQLKARLHTPFLEAGWNNEEVLGHAASQGFDYQNTWSCLWGYRYHCGRCTRCLKRKNRFVVAGISDETIYATPEQGLSD